MRVCLIALMIVLVRTDLFATWSIIIIDPVTNEIGIAGASCSRNCFGIGAMVPGKGAIIVQAMSNKEAQAKGIAMIEGGATAEEIITALRDQLYDPENQQYAVIILNDLDRPAGYTGEATSEAHGVRTEPGISVQGNILAGDDVLDRVMEAARKGKAAGLPIHQILMNALEAGSAAGGDKRCGGQKATSAFVTACRPDEKKPYLELVIFGQKKGGPNAVEMLSKKYKKWWLRQNR